MTVVNLAPSKFRIESTVELSSSLYSAETPDSELYRAAARTDQMNLSMGLLDDTLTPLTIAQIIGGTIDEYEITVTPSSLVGRVRGRNQAARALDTTFNKKYLRTPITPVLASAVVPLVDSVGNVLPVVPTVYGRFMASHVAGEACSFAGVGLSWQIPDYELLVDFTASGRVIDILHTLVAPWVLVEPFRADIYVEGDTLYVKPRPFPITAPNYSFTLADARRNQITIRKRPARRVGTVTLRGARVGVGMTGPSGAGGLSGGPFTSGEQVETELHESFDPAGNLITRVSKISTYRLPDHVLTKQEKATYATSTNEETGESTFGRAEGELIINEWTTVQYDQRGAISQARQLSQIVQIDRVDPDDPDKVDRIWETDTTEFNYDVLRFLTGTTTKKQKFNLETHTLDDSELIVKTLTDVGPLLVEQIVETYDITTTPPGLRQRDVQTNGGHRPGGPGRSTPIKSPGNADKGGSEQITLIRQINTEIDAVDVVYQNENLNLSQLQVIMNQFVAAASLWEYEILFQGVAMPWLKRGATVQFTNIYAEDGVTPLPLPNLYITEVRSEYDESKVDAEQVSSIRAFGWSAV
jgi:hypothetical protein